VYVSGRAGRGPDVLTRLSLFGWLVSLERLDAAPERQAALAAGYDLAALAAGDRLVAGDGQGHDLIGRLLAELESDGWIAWDWVHHVGDSTSEQPLPTLFDGRALQRARNIRITPEGYAAFSARQGLAGAREPVDRALDTSEGEAQYDLFISHASEDKEAVARPLAEALTALGFAVWYDEERIEVGSSLRMSIDAGLAGSRYGIVVVSQAFFAKPWPQQELNGLFSKELAAGEEVILPLWHDIDVAFLTARAPMIADRFALSTNIGVAELADRLARRLRRERGRDDLRARAVRPPPPPSPDPAPAAADVPMSRGDDGLAARAQTIAMLRAGDEIGIRELLLFERRAFEESVLDVLQEAGDRLGSSAEPEVLKPIGQSLWSQVDRRLGSLLPLVEYRPAGLPEELDALVRFAGRQLQPARRTPRGPKDRAGRCGWSR